jgi:hypothetical protein
MHKRVLLSFFLFFLFIESLFARFPQRVQTEGPVRYFEFLFLYDSSYSVEQKDIHVHPFYSSYYNNENAYYFKSFLYPIYYYHGTNYWKTWTFLYFFNGEERYNRKEKSEGEFVLTPLFYWGYGNTEKDQFFSFFPFYGTIKDKLAWEEIHFVLFPLYTSWKYKNYQAYSILWPILMWGGDGYNRSDFRFFPLYSSKVHKGKYNHKTFLWPFFQWGWDDLDKKDPRSFFMFFPFYSQKNSQSGSMYAYSILYPISLFAWGKDEKSKSVDFKFLWILFQYSKSENPYIRRYVIFPFYVHHSSGNPELPYYKEMNFYLILWGNLKTESALIQSNYKFFIPFLYHYYRYYPQEQVSTTNWKLWPLIHYWNDDNAYGWRIFALWPFPDNFVEKNWGPLYSIIEFAKYENEDKYFSILWRIFSVRWNKQYDDFNLFFAGFHYKNNPYEFEFNFLGGLLGFSKTVVSKKEQIPLYFYPKYAQILDEKEKESKYNIYFLWFKI